MLNIPLLRRSARPRERGLAPAAPESFSFDPGVGVTARINGATVRVRAPSPDEADWQPVAQLRAQGKTVVVVEWEGSASVCWHSLTNSDRV